jgi:hypothetical protein
MTLSTIPVQISEEAAQHIEQLGLQEPFQRMLDEIPKRIQEIQSIKVGLEHIVDEEYRPLVAIDVARLHPGCDDPSRRAFGHWVTETFPPEVYVHLCVDITYVVDTADGEPSMMSPQDLESELHKKPFLPFRIVTTTGKTYDITERDLPMILVGKRTVIIGFRVAETDANFDRYEVVALIHIVRLEPSSQPQTQAS